MDYKRKLNKYFANVSGFICSWLRITKQKARVLTDSKNVIAEDPHGDIYCEAYHKFLRAKSCIGAKFRSGRKAILKKSFC